MGRAFRKGKSQEATGLVEEQGGDFFLGLLVPDNSPVVGRSIKDAGEFLAIRLAVRGHQIEAPAWGPLHGWTTVFCLLAPARCPCITAPAALPDDSETCAQACAT